MKTDRIKRTAALVLCLVMLFSLTACKSGAVKNVESLISGLGEITADSQGAVEAAEAAYAALSDSDKAQVEGVQTLTDARAALDSALAVKNVEDLIAGLGEITADSEAAVKAAEAAFDALPASEKARVESTQVLTDARAALDEALREAKRQAILGKWTIDFDATQAMADELAGQMELDAAQLKEAIGTFTFKSSLELREDGTYTMVLDAQSFKDGLSALMTNIKPLLKEVMVKMFSKEILGKEDGTAEEIDEILKAYMGMTLDDVIEMGLATVNLEEQMSSMSDANQEGRYILDIDNNVLYFSESLDEEPDTANGENFTLSDGVMEIATYTGKGFFDQFYPVTLTKAP